ncbi:MAG: hypothetical protein Q4C66_13705 [Lachnospiraceae bacterium]|nr:hypothetical protein [Lachnospiraceae bacterium]
MSKSKKSLSVLSGADYRAPKVSAQRAMSKVIDIATSNPWEYFATLTWKPEISRDYWAVKQRALCWKKDIEKSGGKVLLVIGVGEVGGLYHVHALLNDVPAEMIVPGNPNAEIIEVKTDGELWSLTRPEDYNVGLHVIQEVEKPDDYNRIGCYMAAHIPEIRRQFHDGIMANAIDKTTHMYYATRGLGRSRHGSIFIANTDDTDRINSIIHEELSNVSSVSDSYAAAARIRKRLTHKIRVFSNGEQGVAMTMPAEAAHLITDVTIPITTDKYTKYGKVWYRFTGTLKQLTDAFYLSYVPVRGVVETCSEWLAPYLVSEQDRLWLSLSKRARIGEIPLTV